MDRRNFFASLGAAAGALVLPWEPERARPYQARWVVKRGSDRFFDGGTVAETLNGGTLIVWGRYDVDQPFHGDTTITVHCGNGGGWSWEASEEHKRQLQEWLNRRRA